MIEEIKKRKEKLYYTLKVNVAKKGQVLCDLEKLSHHAGKDERAIQPHWPEGGDQERHLKRLHASLLLMPAGIKHFTSFVNQFVLMP